MIGRFIYSKGNCITSLEINDVKDNNIQIMMGDYYMKEESLLVELDKKEVEDLIEHLENKLIDMKYE